MKGSDNSQFIFFRLIIELNLSQAN